MHVLKAQVAGLSYKVNCTNNGITFAHKQDGCGRQAELACYVRPTDNAGVDANYAYKHSMVQGFPKQHVPRFITPEIDRVVASSQLGELQFTDADVERWC